MGFLSCCFGDSDTKEERGVGWTQLPAWAPLPGEAPAAARGGGGVRAPAFGEGALRTNEFAPPHAAQHKQRTGERVLLHIAACNCLPMNGAAALHHRPVGLAGNALFLPPAKPAFASPRSAAGRAASPFSSSTPLPGDDPFAASPASPAAPAAAGGWEAEPEWLREQAALLAQQQVATGKARGGLWGRSRSPSPPPPPAPAAGPPRRNRQAAGQQRAPAFGEGALEKWH